MSFPQAGSLFATGATVGKEITGCASFQAPGDSAMKARFRIFSTGVERIVDNSPFLQLAGVHEGGAPFS